MVTGSGFVPGDLGWIRMHLPPDGSVEVREVTDELAVIGLWGPAARRILAARHARRRVERRVPVPHRAVDPRRRRPTSGPSA